MVDYKYFDLFKHSRGSVDKEWKMEYDGGVITNGELFDQSIELSESLCSEQELRFGCCEAATLKFKVGNVVSPLMDRWLAVSVTVDHHQDEPLMIGRYRVVSDKPTADRRHREIEAYDAMYDILNADVAAWYNTVLPTKGSVLTLKQFRESFIRHFGLEEALPQIGEDSSGQPIYGLVNDDMAVERTIEPEQISGRDVITAICEINGCFGHIGRDGKFHYIYLSQDIQGMWPANDLYPAENLFPVEPGTTRIGTGTYINCKYEELIAGEIDKLQIRQEENDIGLIYGEGDNCYIIEDNFLVYGKSSKQLGGIAANLYGKITGIRYRPFECEAMGNPCFEVGDPVRLPTKYELVETYILSRTLKGIQALRDSYRSQGTAEYGEKVNSVHKSIVQLKGKSNVLTRTIEETRLEMKDMGEGLSNEIRITAGQIRAELKNEVDGLNNTITVTAKEIRAELTDTKNELSNTISVTAGQIRTELKNTKDGLESTISQTASEIRTEVANADAGLSSRITQNATSISAEVTRATKAEGNLSASISVNAGNIATKVSKDSVISEINQSAEQITIKAGKIDLEGLVRAEAFETKYATINKLNTDIANVNEIISKKASVSDLEAATGRIESLETDHVSASVIEAINGEIGDIKTDYITAKSADLKYMEVENWTKAGYINAEKIDVDSLFSGTISVMGHFGIASVANFSVANRNVGWVSITVGTRSYRVLGEVD